MTGKRRRHFLAGIVHPAYGVVIPKKYRQIFFQGLQIRIGIDILQFLATFN
jgi:hypothetical protein